jgi:BirA family biotin operon repressor/biotin-[acetyl-CoA-carboxylase] ligase
VRQPLQSELVTAALVTSGKPWQSVEFHPSIASTNVRAAEIARGMSGPYAAGLGTRDSPLWRIVLTDDQTGGRGRLGRSWEVPPMASIAVTAIVPSPPAAEIGWVPLLAGVALARAVEAVTESSGHRLAARLKWPNDLLLPEDGDRKVAGILCELVGPGDSDGAVLVGTGVNVDQDRDELPVDAATSLRLAGARVSREDLLVAYLTELAAVLRDAGARADYRRRCTTIGSEVRVHLPGGVVAEGTAVRVDDTGALVVQSAAGERAYSAGDVVHVRPEPRLLA